MSKGETLKKLWPAEGIGGDALGLLGLILGQDGGLGGLKDAIQTAQHGKGQDHTPVFGLFVITAKQVSDRPDKGRQGLLIHEVARSLVKQKIDGGAR